MRRSLDYWMRRIGGPLAKRAERAARRELAAARRRVGLRARVVVAAIIRREFPEAGPAVCQALRLGEEAMAELAAIPDIPALRAADDALIGAEPAAAQFAARLARIAARHDGEDFDPAHAAPAELLVYAALRPKHEGLYS